MANSAASLGGDDIGVKLKQDLSISSWSKGSNFARLAYEYQRDGYHFEAIDFYTKAISLDPTDHRYYVNRSSSYEAAGHYALALADAEKSIELDNSKPKGHFRKGRCLRLLNRPFEAESCFERVLQIVPDCEDTLEELDAIGKQISKAEFEDSFSNASPDSFPIVSHFDCNELPEYQDRKSRSKDQTVRRSNEKGYSTETQLSMNGHKSKVVQSESTPSERSKRIAEEKTKKDNFSQVRFESKFGPDEGPTNLLGYRGVYVGHIDPNANIEDIRRIFSKYGMITHLTFRPEKFCAFVSYNNTKSPREAIQFLNDKDVPCLNVEGKTLKLNFHVAFDQDSRLDILFGEKQRRTINNECYEWRTTGCNEEQCEFRHLKLCRGIDYQSWMKPGVIRDPKTFKTCPFTSSTPRRH